MIEIELDRELWETLHEFIGQCTEKDVRDKFEWLNDEDKVTASVKIGEIYVQLAKKLYE